MDRSSLFAVAAAFAPAGVVFGAAGFGAVGAEDAGFADVAALEGVFVEAGAFGATVAADVGVAGAGFGVVLAAGVVALVAVGAAAELGGVAAAELFFGAAGAFGWAAPVGVFAGWAVVVGWNDVSGVDAGAVTGIGGGAAGEGPFAAPLTFEAAGVAAGFARGRATLVAIGAGAFAALVVAEDGVFRAAEGGFLGGEGVGVLEGGGLGSAGALAGFGVGEGAVWAGDAGVFAANLAGGGGFAEVALDWVGLGGFDL